MNLPAGPTLARSLRNLFIPLFAAMTMFPAVAARADDWGTLGLDASHGRLSAERSGALFSGPRWAVSFPGPRVLASPVVADGFAVIVDLDGAVHALRANDGTLVWQAALKSAVHGTPAVAQGRVFIPIFGNKLVALRLSNGAPLWERDLGGTMLSSPTPVGADIVVAAGLPQRHVVRLSGASGAVMWRSAGVMEQFGNTPAAIGEGLAVVGSNGGHYYAFDIVTGSLRWDYMADGIVHLASPIIAGGRVYLAGGGNSDRVHAVSAATGERISGWPIDLPAPEVDIAGKRMARSRAVSSFSVAGRLLLLQTRLDDALDTDGNATIDRYLSREMVVGLDPNTGILVWQRALARSERQDPNDVPKFFVCPTPATFGTATGYPLAAVASSLDATVAVLDVATGDIRARHTVAGPALASPVLANGRIVVAALNGTLEGLLSTVNRPPSAPILYTLARPLDAVDGRLRWQSASDPDNNVSGYELRVDSDGELLETWMQRFFLGAGETSPHLTGSFAPGVVYSFAVRTRDSHGAYSPWSATGMFRVTTAPPVTVAGMPAAGLLEALRMARPGDEIALGAGTYTLGETLHVKAGISIRGAGAGRTRLDATGLTLGIQFEGAASDHRAGLDGVTVTGADTCLRVAGGSTGIHLSHLIAHDCGSDGVVVEATGAAAIANATLVGNERALHALGAVSIKNSLLTANGVALAVEPQGALFSRYNDLFGNQVDYRGATAGTGDFSMEVAFADLGQRDLRLLTTQASTDKGDPADPNFGEPVPDGERINLGAFGGTADAEQSNQPSTPVTVGGSRPTPAVDSSPTVRPENPRIQHGTGCTIAEPSGVGWPSMLAPLTLLLVYRRRASHGSQPRRR